LPTPLPPPSLHPQSQAEAEAAVAAAAALARGNAGAAAPVAACDEEGAEAGRAGALPPAELARAERLFQIYLAATGEFFALRRGVWRRVCAALHPDRGWDTGVWQYIAQLHQRIERTEHVALCHAHDAHCDAPDAAGKLQLFRESARAEWKRGDLTTDAFGVLVERAETLCVRGYADVVLEIMALSASVAQTIGTTRQNQLA
jgi:hypothetical protein